MNIFGSDPATLTAFEDKASGGSDFRLAEHVGKTLVISVLGMKEVKTANYGVKNAVNVDVVVLNDDGTGEKFEDALIFNAAPVDQLKSFAGQTIVANVTTYTAKSGTRAPKFEAPDEAAIALAKKYDEAN